MARSTLDSSLNELSDDALTMQIAGVKLPLAPLMLVSRLYGESLGRHGFTTV